MRFPRGGAPRRALRSETNGPVMGTTPFTLENAWRIFSQAAHGIRLAARAPRRGQTFSQWLANNWPSPKARTRGAPPRAAGREIVSS